MRLLDLPAGWLVAADVFAWLAIHLGVAYLATQLPAALFSPRAWLYRPRRWERDGRLYERALGIKRWKDRLPDGAALFRGGFRKARLAAVTTDYVAQFAGETCRGEAVHWGVLLLAPAFFLWNSTWAGWVMIGYAALANGPCILAQRYNRIRLLRVLRRPRGRPAARPPAGGDG